MVWDVPISSRAGQPLVWFELDDAITLVRLRLANYLGCGAAISLLEGDEEFALVGLGRTN